MNNKITITKKEYDYLIDCKNQFELIKTVMVQRLANGCSDMKITISKK